MPQTITADYYIDPLSGRNPVVEYVEVLKLTLSEWDLGFLIAKIGEVTRDGPVQLGLDPVDETLLPRTIDERLFLFVIEEAGHCIVFSARYFSLFELEVVFLHAFFGGVSATELETALDRLEVYYAPE